MRRIAILAALLLCCLPLTLTNLSSATQSSSPLVVSAVAAQDMFTLEGKITEKHATKLTVSGSDNVIFHVLYNDKTEIRKKDGSAGTAQDLQIGSMISVAGDLAESGEITAKKIDIETEGSQKQ